MAIIYGTNGNDIIAGTDQADIKYGLGGDDVFLTSWGVNHYDGGSGNNTLDFTGSFANGIRFDLTAGELYFPTGEIETFVNIQNIIGTPSNDVIIADTQDNILRGGAGNDVIVANRGWDVYDGGTGNDTVDFSYSSQNGTIIDLGAGAATFTGGTVKQLISIENAIGSQGNDTIVGTGGNSRLEGGAGNDTLIGNGGNNTLLGGAGDDVAIVGPGRDVFTGGSGSDTMVLRSLPTGQPHAFTDFSPNVDVIDLRELFGSAGNAITAGNLASYVRIATVGGTPTLQIDTGGTGSNFVSAVTLPSGLTSSSLSLGSNLLVGDGSAPPPSGQVLYATTGNDVIVGGAGDDLIYANVGWDTYNGGAGNDTVDFSYSNSNNVVIDLAAGTADFANGFTVKQLVSIENIVGTNGSNTIIGNGGNNRLDGNGGNDTLIGNGGNNTLLGGAGDDVAIVGPGRDVFTGGSGADTMVLQSLPTGQAHAFTDFSPNVDVIDLRELFGSTGDAITQSNLTSYVRIATVGGTPTLQIDVDGPNGPAGFVNAVTLPSGLTSSSLVLGDNLLVAEGGPSQPDQPPPVEVTYIDPRDYGAVANDGRDDWAAIQTALNVAAAIGAQVKLPAGTFHYSNGLRVDSTALLGDGFGTILVPTNSSHTNVTLTGDAPMVADFTMAMPFAQTRAHSWGWHRVVVQDAEDFVVQGVMIEGARGTGIHVESPGGSFGGLISGNVVLNTKSSGIHVTQRAENIIIENNWVQNTGDTGIEIIGYNKHWHQPQNITIRDNVVIDNVWGKNIDAAGARNIQIIDNFVSDNLPGLSGIMVDVNTHYDLAPTDNIYIAGNVVQGAGGFTYGQGAITIAASRSPATNVVIEDNIVLHAGKQALLLTGAQLKDVTAQSNVFAGLRFEAIEVFGPHNLETSGNMVADQRVTNAQAAQWRLDEPFLTDIRPIVWGTALNQINPNTSTAGQGRVDVTMADMLPHVLRAGDGGQTLQGTSADELLIGGAGNDVLQGGGGDDLLVGGGGNDQLFGGAGNDVLFGGAGNDVLQGGSGNDWLSGGPGVDQLYGGTGADVFALSGWAGTGDRDVIHDFTRGVDTLDLRIYTQLYGQIHGNLAAFTRLRQLGDEHYAIDLDPTGRSNFGVAFELTNIDLGNATIAGLVANGDLLI